MWKVLVSERFYKDLEKALKGLPDDEVRSILQKLDELAEELHITPYPAHRFNLRKVVGKDHVEIRVRLGKFRANLPLMGEEHAPDEARRGEAREEAGKEEEA